ncbi:zinc-ribbon domain containing protein [Chryseobacterium sp. YIM B08800]|uniref:zinc-ribbon domain containing protein n=1 Tax=Chryseobacterium sp. YIM B08800 TaxID=2984136 RepID=UPI00223F5B93|nr:zinc-ribbon domain containing protein [Chryseobacterium sp. YIM B08800]
MKHEKNKSTKCKCCGLVKDKHDVSICLSVLKKIDFLKDSDQKHDLYESLIDNNFEWACDQCINDKRALIANPSQQNHSYYFYFVYYDSNINCKKCKKEFTFTKEEKKFWYESLKFRKESTPIHCLSCRKEIRKEKLQNKRLSEILKKDSKDMTIEELYELVQIYDEWEIKDKFNFYNKILKAKQN